MKIQNCLRKLVLGLVASVALGGLAQAAEEEVNWDAVPNKLSDQAALQNGAKLFVNYCLSCHSAAFMRYTRLTDLGLTEQQIKDNLLLTDNKLGETMKAAINPKQAAEWFGANPPDLSVIARVKPDREHTGANTAPDYLYTYLRTFYRDETRPTGWNNKAFPNVGMPHVLWELQTKLTPAQYDDAVADLVNYMAWMAEPSQSKRTHVGVWVLAFLALLTFLTWRLNAAYWKDVK